MPAHSILSGVVLALPLFLLMLSRMFGWPQPSSPPRQRDVAPDSPPQNNHCCGQPPRKPRPRVEFAGTAITAYAWPSEGGILHRAVDGLDLQHLGVSRTASTPHSDPFDQVAEDQWADKLRQLAPQWSPHEYDLELMYFGMHRGTLIEQTPVYVAWSPDGRGVWVLRFTYMGEEVGFAAYHACLTAAERCDVLRKFGGQFYENPDEVYELSKEYTEEFRRQRGDHDVPSWY